MTALDQLMRQVRRRQSKPFLMTKSLSRGFIKDAIIEKMYALSILDDNIEVLDLNIQGLTKDLVDISLKCKEV